MGAGLELSIRLPDGPLYKQRVRWIRNQLHKQNILIEDSQYTNSLMIMPPLVIAGDDLTVALHNIVDIIGASEETYELGENTTFADHCGASCS